MDSKKATLLVSTLLAVACARDPQTSCFEVQEKGPEGTICGYVSEELDDMTDALMPLYPQACFPLDECPDECPADAVINDHVLPELYKVFADYTVETAEPLCRQDDVETGECCFFAIVTGHSGE